MKSLIIYYSQTGRTKALAEKIESRFHCDVIALTPQKKYGNYLLAVLQAGWEKITRRIPGVTASIPNTSQYDAIFIGYPVWYYDVPAFMTQFLKKCDFENKTVIPFATSGSTDIIATLQTLETACAGAVVRHPFICRRRDGDTSKAWLDAIEKELYESI